MSQNDPAGTTQKPDDSRYLGSLDHIHDLLDSGGKILVATVGLPRSGKSSWLRAQGYPIVSPDAIRMALHGQRYYQPAEQFCWATAILMVRSLFGAGHQIVGFDSCCNTRKRRDELQSLVEWSTFFKPIDTCLEVCLERAATMPLEDQQQIVPTIHRMAARHEPIQTGEQVWP